VLYVRRSTLQFLVCLVLTFQIFAVLDYLLYFLIRSCRHCHRPLQHSINGSSPVWPSFAGQSRSSSATTASLRLQPQLSASDATASQRSLLCFYRRHAVAAHSLLPPPLYSLKTIVQQLVLPASTTLPPAKFPAYSPLSVNSWSPAFRRYTTVVHCCSQLQPTRLSTKHCVLAHSVSSIRMFHLVVVAV